METKQRRVVRPFWVRVGLAGLPGRGAALAFFWVSVALALGFFGTSLALVVAGAYPAYWVGLLLPALGMVLAALWYGLAIRWVDRHDRWDSAPQRGPSSRS